MKAISVLTIALLSVRANAQGPICPQPSNLPVRGDNIKLSQNYAVYAAEFVTSGLPATVQQPQVTGELAAGATVRVKAFIGFCDESAAGKRQQNWLFVEEQNQTGWILYTSKDVEKCCF